MTTTLLAEKTLKASTQSIRFKDGMLVTAEDLETATSYPLDVIQVLVRAYFGCGIVCGFELASDKRVGKRGESDNNCPPPNSTYVLEIGYGVALDCHGFPIELCGPFRIDLTPDPCAKAGPITGKDTRRVQIAIRRSNEGGPSPHPCGCKGGCSGGCSGDCDEGCGEQQCSRLRDHVVVGSFDFEALPDNICRREPPKPDKDDKCNGHDQVEASREQDPKKDICGCLMECGRDCCGESWVLLGTVTLDAWGITDVDTSARRYVKPIECPCAPKPQPVEPPKDEKPPEPPIIEKKAEEVKTENAKQFGELKSNLDAALKRIAVLEKPVPPKDGKPPEPPPVSEKKFEELRTKSAKQIDALKSNLDAAMKRIRLLEKPVPPKPKGGGGGG